MSDLIDDPVPGQNLPEYSVSEISGAVKRTLEDEFGRIRVRGEVGRVVDALRLASPWPARVADGREDVRGNGEGGRDRRA